MVVIFDWDGTLHDSKDAVIKAWIKTGRKWGLKLSSDRIVNSMVTDVKGMGKLLGFPEKEIEEASRIAVKEFEKVVMNTNSIFPQVKETLDKLNENHKLAIYSNGVNSMVNKMLRKYKLQDYFDVVITSETAIKPSRDGIDIILNELGEKKGFMVDDAPEGIMAAKSAGIFGIGALYGIDPHKLLLSKPNAVVNSVSEVPMVIKKLTKPI